MATDTADGGDGGTPASNNRPPAHRPPYLSVALISAAALAYEILLMRLFSIIQWHHFAYLAISLAPLGYGASGSLISVAANWLLPRFRQVYIGSLGLFGLSAPACYAIAQSIPFNAGEVVWNPDQLVYLLQIFLLLTLPFLLASTAICIALTAFSRHIPRLYAVDLLGAGLGSVAVVVMLTLMLPQTALAVIGITGLVAALVAVLETRIRYRLRVLLPLLALMLLTAIGTYSLQLTPSPYKGLSQTLRIAGTQVVAQRSSPLGLLTVVASEQVPFRHAPGMSLNARQEPLQQLALFTDGANMTAITRYPDDRAQLGYLDQMSAALPYHLAHPRQVLVVGTGGGGDLLLGQYHHVPRIDALELNPQVVELVSRQFGDFSGHLFEQPGITLHVAEARGFLTNPGPDYDLIQLALLDAFNASSSGLYALSEDYLYTREALTHYLDRLSPGGYLAITRWIKIPPRDTLKLFATAVEVLRERGVADPGRQLLLIRGWQTSTLVVKNGAFNTTELAAAREFCHQRSFDLAWMPGMAAVEANQYNQLREPLFFDAARAMLGSEAGEFFASYKFDLRPASDDRPYFHHFFKWSTLAEILSLRGRGGLSLIETGYLVLVATLLIAVVVSTLLILLPLALRARGRRSGSNRIPAVRVMVYFFAIGLAFLFIEIAYLQRFILFLHQPIVAIAVTLASFLVFAGAGSHASERLLRGRSTPAAIGLAVMGIALIASLYLVLLPWLFSQLAGLAMGFRIALSIALIAPLAFCMGMPLPLAMSSVARHAPDYVPWAWGINGCASVISAVLATLLAMSLGFTAVVVLAILTYLLALLALPVRTRN